MTQDRSLNGLWVALVLPHEHQFSDEQLRTAEGATNGVDGPTVDTTVTMQQT